MPESDGISHHTPSALVQAVHESEERFRQLADMLPQAIYEMDLNGRVTYANRRAYEFFGYTLADFQAGVNAFDMLTPESLAEAQRNAQRLRQGHETNGVEYTVRRKDGSRFPALLYSAPILRDGRPVGFRGLLVDITAKRQAEQAQRFQADLLDQIGDHVTATDLEGRITYVNAVQVRAFGRSREELIGQHVTVYGEDATRGATQQEILEQTIEHGRWRGEVVNYLKDDGSEIILDCRTWVLRDAAGRPTGLCGISTDITERKRAEEALRASEGRFRAITENTGAGTVICDTQGVCQYASPSVNHLLGYGPDQLQGRNWSEFVLGADSAIVDRIVQQVFELPGRTLHVPTVHVRASDGRDVALEVWVTGMLDVPGVNGIVANFTDITERKQAERKQAALREQLFQAQKMEAIGQLAGGIAHDFNNLLTGVLGHANLLRLQSAPGSAAHEAAAVIEQAAERAADLTRQLLGFAQRGKHRVVPVDVPGIIAEVVRLLEHTLDKNVRVESRLTPYDGEVMGDPGQIHQVLLNLAVNARDAMPHGGVLRFEVEPAGLADDFQREHPAVKRPGRYVIVTVADTGVGVAPEIHDRVFEPFFTTKTNAGGSGMGLAMAYGIVENHGGAIELDSRPGHGARFRVLLPLADDGPPPEARAVSPTPGADRSARVLIVDDEPAVRDIAALILRTAGHSVTACSSGEEALACYRDRPDAFDVVIVDMIMPGMDGAQCAEALRRIDPTVRLILSTGYVQPDAPGSLCADQQSVFLQKPYRARELAAAVRDALERE